MGSHVAAEGSPRRVHVVGGPGSGKSTLARRIGARLGVAVHHLDDVYRVGGGTGALRSELERQAAVASILAESGWVTEGVHLGWTEPFFESADLLVWLDTVGWQGASRRMTRRFAARPGEGVESTDAPATRTLRRRGVDGAQHARDLVGAVLGSRIYYRRATGTANLPETRAATAERIARHPGRVVHCRTDADIEALLAVLSTRRDP